MLYDESEDERPVQEEYPVKMGRPRYKPTQKDHDLIRALAIGRGRTHEYIARYIGISRSTLERYYADILSDTKDTRNMEVENSLYIQAAVKQEFRATAYWLEKNYREKYGQDPSGEVDQSEFLAAIAKVLKPGVQAIDKVNPEPVDNSDKDIGKVGEPE